MASIAIIGADGAGKSTVCQAVIRESDLPLRYVYMGVNLEASRQMLPTTRLVLWLKQRRGLRPDATFRGASRDAPSSGGVLHQAKSLLRLAFWVSEEWYRQLLVWLYELRGYVVISDRHFYADYFAYDVMPRARRRSLASALHGIMLEKLYPKPGLFILLSAPPEVLFERKGEGTIEFLKEREEQYLRMKAHVKGFEIVDAAQPQEAVVRDVEALIRKFVAA